MMIIDKEKKIGLNSPMFDRMREALDIGIRSIFSAMDRKDIGKSTITLKINIETLKGEVDDDNSPTGKRTAIYPKINFKLTDKLEAKGEVEGKIVENYDNELVRDDTGAYCIVSREEASGQLNMFNGYDEEPNDEELNDEEPNDVDGDGE